MTYNKTFRMTLSAAVLASLMIGCQGSDKQKTQVRRGGATDPSQLNKKNQSTLSDAAKTLPATDTTVEKAKEAVDSVAQVDQKRILIKEMETGEYILTRVAFSVDKQAKMTGTQSSRLSIVADVAGDGLCSLSAAQVQSQSTQQQQAQGKVRPQNAPINKNVAATCDSSKFNIVSSLTSGVAKDMIIDLGTEALTLASAYSRFTVIPSNNDNKIVIDPKNGIAITAGINTATKAAAFDIQAGVKGDVSVFSFITENNKNSSNQTTNVYSIATQGATGMGVSIRKISDDMISITYERDRNATLGRFDQFVFQYKLVKRTSSNGSTKPKVDGVNITGGDTTSDDEAKIAKDAANIKATDSDAK